MRLLHITTSLYTGGAETLIVNLMPRFKALGYEVGVVVFNGERTALMERLEKECPECKIYCLGHSYYNPWYIVKLIRIMRHYDIVHAHNSSPQLFAAIANIFCHKKLVTTEHSTNNRKREKGGIFRLVDKWMYRRYNNVICISEIAEKELREYLGSTDEQEICTINNGVDVEIFHKAEPLSELKTEKFVAVMVAGFREAKDQDTLIKSMLLLPKEQYELWLVGDGVRRGELQNLVRNLNLQENVKFLGLRTDVPNVLKSADVVVMSSHWEGFGLAAVEGMAVTKPVVVSNVLGLAQVVKGSGILFPHEDEKVLAETIIKLHDDKVYYKQVADKCYERAQQFDIKTMVEAYNNIYLSLKQ